MSEDPFVEIFYEPVPNDFLAGKALKGEQFLMRPDVPLQV